MKKYIIPLLLINIVYMAMYIGTVEREKIEIKNRYLREVELTDRLSQDIFNLETELDSCRKELEALYEYWEIADSISQKESGGNYEAVNSLGYLGKYQFSTKTLKMLNIDTTRFLSSPLKQELAMRRYYLWCKKYFIEKLGQKVYENNRWRLHMAAHLAGPAGAVRYLQEGYNPSDAYGTTVEDYASL